MSTRPTPGAVMPGPPEVKRHRPLWISIVGIGGIVFACFNILGSTKMVLTPTLLKTGASLLISERRQQSAPGGAPQAPGGTPQDLSTLEDALGAYEEMLLDYSSTLEDLLDEAEAPRARRTRKTRSGEKSLADLREQLKRQGEEKPEKRPAKEPATRPLTQKIQKAKKVLSVPGWFGTACVAFGTAGFVLSGLYMFACISLLSLRRHAVVFFYVVTAVALVVRLAWMGGFVASGSLLPMFLAGAGMVGLVVHLVLLTFVATGDKIAFRPAAPFEDDGDGSGTKVTFDGVIR